MKQKLFTLLTLLCFAVSGAWADEISVTAFKASGSSPYTYECISNGYAINEVDIVTSDVVNNPVGSSQLKVPASGTLTVSAHGKTITSIVIVWNKTPSLTVNVGSLSTSSKTTTWTGSATSVVFTSSAANQFGSITVTYDGSFADGIGSSVTLSDLTRGLYNSSSIYTIGCTTTPSVYGIYLKGKVGTDINIDNSSNSGTLTIRSPKAMSSIVLNWTDSKGNSKNPSMTPSSGTYNSETNTWTAANTTTKEVTFTNGESSKYYLKNQDIELSFASTDPTITVDPTSADPFTYVVGSGPSTAQTFTATLSNQTSDDITVSLQSGSSYYEISDDGSTYGTSNLTIGTGDEVYVRLKSGLSNNTYEGTLRFANEGADNVDIDLSGSVTNQTYTVTYELNGASGDAPTETAKEKDEVFALAAAPTRDCYTFDGWLCDIDGVTYAAGDDYTMTAAPTTFTAQWTANYASGTYDFESSATVGTSPSKTITTDEVEYDAFRIDNLFFGASKLAYDDGTSDFKFKGWKIKKSGSTIKFMVENNSAVYITIGANNGCNITYTPIGSTETTEALSATDNTTTMKTVKAGTIVTLSTTSKNTVCLKTIKFSNVEAISTASGKNYATYVTTNALDFASVSDEIKAYVAASTASAGSITFTGKDEVPASTPLLIKTASAGATVYVPVIASADAVDTNYLVAGDGGNVTYDASASHFYYILTNGEFKQANNSPVAVGKAYLALPSAATSNELTINFDDDEAGDVTAIATVSSKKQNNGEYYNLNGQRVDASHKGIVIVNGKKFFNK